jgi:hypothetical protein
MNMNNFYISVDTEPDLHNPFSFNGITKGILKLTELLDKYQIKATFFVTADILKKYPKVFQNLKKQGHEIALHGYKHERFDDLSYNKKEELIRKSVKIYKELFKTNPLGFRAPQHSIDNETLKILEKYDFKYDSSLTPWNFYHIFFFWKIKIKFFHNFKSMRLHKIGKIYEIPSSSMFFPFSALTIRVLPKFLLKIYLYFVSKLNNPVFLMHSWDVIDIPKSKLSRLFPPNVFLSKLDYSFSYLSKKGNFSIIKNLIPPI